MHIYPADYGKALRESLMLSTAMAQNATLHDNKALRESLMLSTAISERSNEHGDNHAETEYNHDLAHPNTEERNHAIEDHNEVMPSAVPNQHQITEALTSLRKEVKASQDISLQQHAEVLKQLESSGGKAGRITSIVCKFFAALGAVDTFAKIWSRCGDSVKNFFGMFLGILAEFCSRCGDLIDLIKNLLGPYE